MFAFLEEYLDKVTRPLVLILPKISGKTFKVKDGDKDTSNKLMSFHIDDDKLLEKNKTTWTKIEELLRKYVKFNALPVFADRYIKTKIRKYGDKNYTNFICARRRCRI